MVSSRFQQIAITLALGLLLFGGSVVVGAPTSQPEDAAAVQTSSDLAADASNLDGIILPRIITNADGIDQDTNHDLSSKKRKSSKKKFDALEHISDVKNAGGIAAELIPSLFIRDESDLDEESRKRPKKHDILRHHRKPRPRPPVTPSRIGSKKPAPRKSLLDPVSGVLGTAENAVGGVLGKAGGLLGGLGLGGLL